MHCLCPLTLVLLRTEGSSTFMNELHCYNPHSFFDQIKLAL